MPSGQLGKLFALLRTLMQATPPLGGTTTIVGIAAVMALPAVLLAPDLVRPGAVAVGDGD